MPVRLLSYVCGSLLAVSALAAPKAAPKAVEKAPAEKLPTTDQMYATFENGDYPKVLRQLSTVLALKGDAAERYDRHELLALKAETLLRQKSFAGAADAFDAAARATIVETKAAVDRSTAELIRRSKAGLYTPAARKGAAAIPIDVTDPLNRPAAFEALFEESAAKVEAAVKAAQGSLKLPPILDAFRMIYDLRLVEQAASGSDARSMELAAPLTDKARSMMARAVADLSRSVDRMSDPSQQEYIIGPCGDTLRRDYSGELSDIAAECDRIGRVAADLLKHFAGDKGAELRKLMEDAAEVGARARSAGNVAWQQGLGYGQGWKEEAGYEQPRPVIGPDGRPVGGTTGVQRPNLGRRGTGTAGNRGVGTGGVGTGTR